jgi:hypothetical protein
MKSLPKTRSVRLALCMLGALVVPFGTITVYIELTRDLPITTTPNGLVTDLPVFLASIGIGTASILAFPCRWLYRILVAIAYMPVFFFALAFFWFVYEMARTGIWV